MTKDDVALAVQVLRRRATKCTIPDGKAALERVIGHLEGSVGRLPVTQKTDWCVPGRGETVEALLELIAPSLVERYSTETRRRPTALKFLRPGPPLAYDLTRAKEALRRVGVEVA